MKLNRPLLRAWVNALRSGKYTQTSGALRVGHGYCCLGVLADVKARKSKISFSDAAGHKGPNDATMLNLSSRWVQECGLKERYVCSSELGIQNRQDYLVYLNDTEGFSFKKIATWIEKNILSVRSTKKKKQS